MADDRISQLPNDLLITILSSTLTLKEAAATSILSKRWKTLWTYYYGFFDFDYHSHLLFDDYLSQLSFIKPCFDLYRLFEECTNEYVNHVDEVLHSHREFGVPIKKFRICWMMRNELKTVMDSWIKFAKKKRVKHIELDLFLKNNNNYYKFPHGIGFPNLTVLHLDSVDVTDENLAYLVSSDNFPSLQHISVKYAPSLEHIKVVGNLKLKSLEFFRCGHIKNIEISSAINMVSFGFSGEQNTKVTLEDVPLVTKALFGFDYFEKNAVMQLSSFLLPLEILVLDLICFENYVRVANFPKFDKLKCLELQGYTPYSGYMNISFMQIIYRRCPRLQKLSLKMYYTNIKWRPGALSKKNIYKHRHECLQDVEYIGWNGKENDMEVINYILNSSVVLDKVTIDPRTTFYSKFQEIEVKCKNKEFLMHEKKREEDARKAAQKLRRILPRRVTLVIL